MALTRTYGIDNGFRNAADDRKVDAALISREGMFPDPITTAAGSAGVAFAGTGWGVSARAFVAAIKRGGVPYSQAYGCARVANDGVVANAWTVGGAPGAGTRVDLLCIRARDTTQGDSATGAPTDGPSGAARTGFAEWIIAAGTPGTPGLPPAIPAGYLRVATVTTPSGAASIASSTIVNDHAFAAVAGGTIYVRTIAERDALAGLLPGDDVCVLATNQVYTYTGTPGSWLALPGAAHHGGNPGSVVTGIGIPSAAVALPTGLIVKTGALTSTTTVAFGNEYFPSVAFATAFPTACLHVSITPLSGAPISSSSGNPIAIDNLSPSAFRALVPGSGSSFVRGFAWMALGY